MRDYCIYLCGGMEKFGKDNFMSSNNWRLYCKNILENFEINKTITVINPNDYFNLNEAPKYKSAREVMEFDLHKVRCSDLIIVNFNDKYSLGSMAELAIAYERRIPIIGLDMDRQDLHPWQKEMATRIFDDINEMLEYILNFYLT